MAENHFDFAIIGAGIAGASAAAHLPSHARVLLLEAEDAPGYHSTGRSAAIFSAIYGNEPVRALTRASEPFFTAPPNGFAAAPLVSPRGAMFIARADQSEAMEKVAAALDIAGATRRVSAEEACRLSPLLRPDYVAEALMEDGALDIDVNALHAGFLRMARANGAQLVTGARVQALSFEGGAWSIETPAGSFRADVVVNAAGAWADAVAERAGVARKGITPMRRTVAVVDAEGVDAHAAVAIDVDEEFYFKPESGGVLISPADETPNDAIDVAPEDLDIAIAVDRVERATTLSVRRIRSKWAGLRSFAPDRTPVVGFDGQAPGFFWLAGQGGYGIQTAPALGALAAALLTGGGAPDRVRKEGLNVDDLSPARPTLQAVAAE